MSDNYIYPAEFIKKAESRIKAQLTGADINADEIILNVTHQGIGIITGKTLFTLDCQVETRHEKGRKSNGRLIESGQLKSEIDTYIHSHAAKETMEITAIERIKALPLQGFGIEKEILPLKDSQLTLSEQSQCQRCNGQGQSVCNMCAGKGKAQCPLCIGTGTLRCMNCGGTKQIQLNNEHQSCPKCQARGEVYCTQCQGQRIIGCVPCESKGQTPCADCNGQGANTTHATITPTLNIHGDVFIQDLDPIPKNIAAKTTPLIMAKGAHIEVKTIIKDLESGQKDGDYVLKKDNDPNKQAVFYECAMPWAMASLTHAGKTYKISFAGQKGAVCHSDNFMEEILNKNISMIKKASKGDGFVMNLLKDAGKAVFIKDTLMTIASMSKKKSMGILYKKYSLGLSQGTLKSIIINADKALKRITRRPRYVGLAVGLTLSVSIYYAWFMNGLRDNTMNHTDHVRMVIDTLPLCIGLGLSHFTIKGAGYFTFQSVMKTLNLPIKKMPAAGKAGIYGLIGNLVFWALFFVGRIMNLY